MRYFSIILAMGMVACGASDSDLTALELRLDEMQAELNALKVTNAAMSTNAADIAALQSRNSDLSEEIALLEALMGRVEVNTQGDVVFQTDLRIEDGNLILGPVDTSEGLPTRSGKFNIIVTDNLTGVSWDGDGNIVQGEGSKVTGDTNAILGTSGEVEGFSNVVVGGTGQRIKSSNSVMVGGINNSIVTPRGSTLIGTVHYDLDGSSPVTVIEGVNSND
jgi:hypothetical protein